MRLNLSLLQSSLLFLIGGGLRNTLQLHIFIHVFCLLRNYSIIINKAVQYTHNLYSNSMRRNLSTSPSLDVSSLANKYGVAMKENNSLGSMGLNPNLNIQDQYIENLLKQIHFMNMEIKLIKEKQLSSDGNALWGIINRTNQPVVSNIVQSSQKYQSMKRQVDATLYRLQKDIAVLENNSGALNNQKKFLQGKRAEIESKTAQWEKKCQDKHKVFDEKINNWKTNLKYIREQLERQRKRNLQLTQKQSKITFQDQVDKSKNDKSNLQIQNDEIIEEMMEKDITEKIEQTKILNGSIQKIFDEDLEYLHAKQQNKSLKQKMAKIQKNISEANFQIMQLNQSYKMAQLEREKQIRQRKQLTQQYQLKKTMLNEILEMNRIRQEKQIIYKRNNSLQIVDAQEKSQKLQKSLDELKRKLIKNQQINGNLQNQIWKMEKQINICKNRKNSVINQINQLKKSNGESESQLLQLKSNMAILESQYQKTLNSETNSSLDLVQLERQLQYLRGRKQLLNQNLELKDVMNKLNIEDLHKVVQKNNDLNSTVNSLMSKWDDIKTFSRI